MRDETNFPGVRIAHQRCSSAVSESSALFAVQSLRFFGDRQPPTLTALGLIVGKQKANLQDSGLCARPCNLPSGHLHKDWKRLLHNTNL